MAAAAPPTQAETSPEEEWDGFGYADPAASRADWGLVHQMGRWPKGSNMF